MTRISLNAANYLKPWWIILVSNLCLAVFFSLELIGSPIKLMLNSLAVATGAGFSVLISCWVYYFLHQYRFCLMLLAPIIALAHSFFLLLSVVIIWEYHHLPTASEAAFMLSYPRYSLVMAQERGGVSGLLIFLILFTTICLSYIRRDEAWLIRFKRNRKSTIGMLLILLASNIAGLTFAAGYSSFRSLEIHYLQMMANVIGAQPEEADDGSAFVVNRLTLPSLVEVNQYQANRPNILFFRTEEVSREFYGLTSESSPYTTPYIRQLQERSPSSFFVYQNHVSNSGATDTSTTSIYTGLQPNRSGRDFGHFPMLWDYASGSGYYTQMTVPFPMSWSNLRHKWSGNNGEVTLDMVIDATSSGKPVQYDNSITDRDIADLVISQLESFQEQTKGTQPFFSIVNLKLPHGDGTGVDILGYKKLGCHKQTPRLNIYECSIFVLDREMGRIIDAVDEMGLLEETIIIAAPDHGAALGRHYKGRIYNYYQEVLSIPLFIRIPEKFQHLADSINVNWRNNVNRTTQNLDILPTIVDLMGIAKAPLIQDLMHRLDGTSLLRELPDSRWILSKNTNALRTWEPDGFGITIGKNYKYIFHDGNEYLYDLKADPGELKNLLKEGASALKNQQLVKLYGKIQRYIGKQRELNALYASRFPDHKIYDPDFRYHQLGNELYTKIGMVDSDRASIISNGNTGVLTFGPYVALEEGLYEFRTLYSWQRQDVPGNVTDSTRQSDPRRNATSRQILGYVKDNEWTALHEAQFEPGLKLISSFVANISDKHAGKPLEIANVFNGQGQLEIFELEILRVLRDKPQG